jgi:hypothetical protein
MGAVAVPGAKMAAPGEHPLGKKWGGKACLTFLKKHLWRGYQFTWKMPFSCFAGEASIMKNCVQDGANE